MRILRIALPLALLAACTASPRPEDSPSIVPATAAKEATVVHKVIPLRYAVAHELAATLRGAVLGQTGSAAPQIVSDDRTNSLVVASSPGELASIEKLVADLDVQVK